MGGPVHAMAAYVGLLAEAGYPITVYSARKQSDGPSIELHSKVRLVRERAMAWGGFRRSAALWREAQRARPELLHSHGLWTDVNRLAGDLARRRGVPHLLAPCGMLAAGALRHHRWKKLPVRFWFQDRALREAQCLHAKSHKEFEDIREFGLSNPVAIIANPISPPPRAERISPATFRESFQIPAHQKLVLFLGRLHPVKGLPRLLHAWARIGRQNQKAESRKQKFGTAELRDGATKSEIRNQKSEIRGSGLRTTEHAARNTQHATRNTEHGPQGAEEWRLVLAGPDDGGHRKQFEALAVELGCQDSVLFTGELDDSQKWSAMAAADLFVMPSDFENFGNAIVEAMLSALPVITTTGTPWKELGTAAAGWCVVPGVAELSEALCDALSLPDQERRAMGKRALELAEKFRPQRVAEDLIRVYQWMRGEGARPECVAL